LLRKKVLLLNLRFPLLLLRLLPLVGKEMVWAESPIPTKIYLVCDSGRTLRLWSRRRIGNQYQFPFVKCNTKKQKKTRKNNTKMKRNEKEKDKQELENETKRKQ
jgi:hypothetical protein